MENQQGSALIGSPVEVPVEKVKYVLYARKSTEQDEKQALSIDSQVKEMLAIAERDNLEIIDIRREAHSAKDSGQRPVFKELLEDIRRGRYTGIITWAPDRLSRNAGDLGSLVDLMDQKLLLEIRTYGQQFRNSPNEKFLLMILCSQAKLENDNKSINVKRGLKTRCEMGLWPAPAPTGYFKEKRMDRKCETIIDPDRAPIIKQIFEKVAYEKWSSRKVYHWLKFDLNFKANGSNKNLTSSNIYMILQNHFYYGVFEYPKKSGSWYKGKHEAIINKELFDAAQQQLKRDNIVRSGEIKEFAFTKLMSCGLCGSGISAEDKFKKLKDGTIAKYIYYGCTRSKDMNCKGGYLEEKVLIAQLSGLIDKVDLDQSGLRKKLEVEIERHKKFHSNIMGKPKEEYRVKDVDIRNYAKYVLREGFVSEKHELLYSVKGRILVKNKTISLG